MGKYLISLNVIESRSLYVNARDEHEAVEEVLRMYRDDIDKFEEEAYLENVELNFKDISPYEED